MLPGSPASPAMLLGFSEGQTLPQGLAVSGAGWRGISLVSVPAGGGRAREVSTSSVVLLPHCPTSVVTARCQISTHLRDAGIVTPAIGDAALVVSELLSNAVLHARPLPGARVLVAWALHGRSLEVAVSDGGSMTRPRPAQPSLSSIGGRGLTIVEHLSSRWGVLANDFGLTVWAILRRPARAGPPALTPPATPATPLAQPASRRNRSRKR